MKVKNEFAYVTHLVEALLKQFSVFTTWDCDCLCVTFVFINIILKGLVFRNIKYTRYRFGQQNREIYTHRRPKLHTHTHTHSGFCVESTIPLYNTNMITMVYTHVWASKTKKVAMIKLPCRNTLHTNTLHIFVYISNCLPYSFVGACFFPRKKGYKTCFVINDVHSSTHTLFLSPFFHTYHFYLVWVCVFVSFFGFNKCNFKIYKYTSIIYTKHTSWANGE